MKAIEQFDRLKRMNELIKSERTGTPAEFARMLGVSRRQLYSYIEYFKDMELEINYSKRRSTFHFCNGHELEISYQFKIITKDGSKEINGGFCSQTIRVLFFCTEGIYFSFCEIE
ncbi:MAG: hypothetical protein K8S16_13675 [Bacteroidales bacterium]|nr:hypothetical protein [Bacteroidales bacterium]